MRWLNLVFIFVVVLGSSGLVEAGYDFPIKTTLINKFIQYVYKWLGQSQYMDIAGDVEPQVYPNTTMSDLKTALFNSAMERLNSTQKTKIVGIGAKFIMKYGNYQEAFDILGETLGNNMLAFGDQLKEMYLSYEAAGKTRERIFQRGYKMGTVFMTAKRVNTIYCRIADAFKAKDSTMWPFIKSNFAGIINFSVLDGIAACT